MTPEDPYGGTWPAQLGVAPGDTVLLMADLTRMAWHARRSGGTFTPAGLLEAFLQAVGPGGTLLVPTFTYHLSGGAFDVRSTPSISGALATAALRHPAFQRTLHPLHSFAVAGRDADALARCRHEGSFDAGSPFAHLLANNARLIAIDLPADDAFTFVHHAEEMARVPYRRQRRMRFDHTDADGHGSVRSFSIYAKRPGHTNTFASLLPLLENAGAMHRTALGGSTALVVDLPKAHAVVLADIRDSGGRAIHQFGMERWARDMLKALLRTLTPHTRT